MKKTLYTCGDSWAAASIRAPGKHYSELIADRMGYDLNVLARCGISNPAICLQIEYAIRHKADFIIVSFTDFRRLEIPCESSSNRMDLLTGEMLRRYDKDRGLENINYSTSSHDHNYRFVNNLNSLYSDTINGYFSSNILNSNQKEALKSYVVELLDEAWKEQTDIWGIKYWLRELVDSNIPFVVKSEPYLMNLSWLPPELIVHLNWYAYRTDPEKDKTFKDPGFHTYNHTQEYFADIFYPVIQQVLKNNQ